MQHPALGLFTALTLVAGTAQAAPGYAAPGEPAPAAAPQPAPEPYEPQPYAQPQPYGGPQPYAQPQPYGPQPAPYQPPPQPPRRRGKGMMIAGFVTFGSSYLATALVGAAALDVSRDEVLGGTDDRSRRLGSSLLIPVVGPLVAIPHIETATGTMFAIFSFIAQAGGLSLGIAGAVRYARDGRRMQAAQAGLHLGRGVRLGAAPRLGGGTLNLNYRF